MTHAIGPLWAVNGRALTVSPGEDVRRTVLDAVANMVNATAPVHVVVTDGQLMTKVVLRLDGSSVAQGDGSATWAGPGRAVVPPTVTVRQTSIVGVHPGAGVSTWAELLDLPEAQLTNELQGPVVLVCRSTPAGINATKAAIHSLGPAAVDAVLVVADAPGKPVPAAAREQRVLAGAVRVVPVPWLPRLRAVAEISPALAGQLARPVQRVTKALLGAQSIKEKAE
ncbi:hypothetical protein [Curtobacterium flaccumfaciens]|uniref:hypothetical protein n=1 Tax=Curtobacterium flaccumfaciens TaxID=2035 RepID=UPI001BDEA3BC|nr:hypothetical protein [Curtobacterium flaccumfaciens]MBT1631508.1 hypothetical protein [Curtobacterium flaccumfaciens pv. oortii]MCX2846816.1 hypothetical protein [Curtobacterium flaccumfaciens pv. oortii]